MIINMHGVASEEEIKHVVDRVQEAGYQAHVRRWTERTIIAAVGTSGRRHELRALATVPGVAEVVAIATPFKLVSSQTKTARTVVDIGGTLIGNGDLDRKSVV